MVGLASWLTADDRSARYEPHFARRAIRLGFAILLALTSVAVDLAAPRPVAAAGWATARVTTSHVYGSYAVAVDQQGHLHVATGRYDANHGLYYFTNASGAWVGRRIFSDIRWVSGVDVAVDPAGKVHVVYALSRPDDFRASLGIWYSTNVSGSWTTTQLTNGFDRAPSILIAPTGTIHLSFSRFRGGIYYAAHTSGPWSFARITTIDGAPDLAVDTGGHPQLAFNDALYAYYASKATGTWVIKRLTASTGDEEGALLALAGGSHPRVLTNSVDDGLVLYSLVSGTWRRTRIAGSLCAGPPAGFAVDGLGHNHVACSQFGATALVRYASDRTGTWSNETVASRAVAADIVVSSGGQARVLYGSGAILIATRGVTSWSYQTVATGFDDEEPDLAVGPDGNITMAFVRNARWSEIWFARKHSGTWQLSRVTTGHIDGSPELAVDTNGHHHVVWLRRIAEFTYEVWYATDATGTWQTSILSHAGVAPSIAADGLGHVHVVYSEGPGYGLRYATNASGTLKTSAVFSTGYLYATIAVTAGGTPHLAYAVGSSTRHAWKSGTTWKTEPVSSTGSGGVIAVSPAGKVHIAWTGGVFAPGVFDASNETGSWKVVNVPLAGAQFPVTPDLVVDSMGRPRIVYGDTEQTIWQAIRSGGIWTTARVFQTGDAFVWTDAADPSIARSGTSAAVAFSNWGLMVAQPSP
jgi:hypothetical protein